MSIETVGQATTSAPAGQLRAWQRRALTKYLATKPRDFLAVATPGAGKTTFALRVASELLRDRTVDQITVVAPTEHLKHQWAAGAARVGIALDSNFSNSTGQTSSDFHGVVVTYAQVASHPFKHRVRTEARRTLVILDEIHHGGDAKSWGEGIREAFGDATRRLALTGTPFRSDDSAIPFVTYEPDDDGLMRSKADHSYGYADALADGVVRPVVFLAYSGEARWRTNAGEEFTARLGEPLSAEQTARAWRTALDPAGDWIPAVLRAANTRLEQLRAGRDARRRWARHRDGSDGRPRIRASARGHHRGGARRRAVRRSHRVEADRGVRREHPALDGRGAHGVGRRRRAASRSRGVRDERLHPAVLRAGDRTVRAFTPQGGDRQRLPAVRAGPPRPRQPARGSARPHSRQAAPGEGGVRRRVARRRQQPQGRAGGGREGVPRRSVPTPNSIR